MQMVLNELSAVFPAYTKAIGKERIVNFLDTYKKMKNIIKNDSVILDKEYNSIKLANHYTIYDWRADSTVDEETKRLFRSFINKATPVDKINFNENKFDLNNSEFKCEDEQALGCLIAYETDNVVISFLSNEYWINEIIEGQYLSLDENFEYDEPQKVCVQNVSNEKNISIFERNNYGILNFQEQFKIVSGRDLWNKREELFPNLIFCESVKNQLLNDTQLCHISQILKKLLILEKYFEAYDGNFDKDAIPIKTTPESQATLERYETDHKFRTSDNKELIFSWHVRFTGNYAGRIFFYPDNTTNKSYIGHIGKKLRTVKNP
ncbi:hypothetical protein [Clostridium estertheticum]|uniref:hypothetical protein n=1 Tax=Clostridium estertheticum TaxID=238834 RepID=UPI001C7DD414|nr:hypothetical protein [Clostridium estertheticum]MBX4263765.1 hypothetical protein [Clostridium estertheticum]WLC87579.1 hypothetical protein KTC95_15810 [Clostridium estertheticum]